MKLTITVTGPQGAGKSTVAAAIANLLDAHGIPADLVTEGRKVSHSERAFVKLMPAIKQLRAAGVSAEIREEQADG